MRSSTCITITRWQATDGTLHTEPNEDMEQVELECKVRFNAHLRPRRCAPNRWDLDILSARVDGDDIDLTAEEVEQIENDEGGNGPESEDCRGAL